MRKKIPLENDELLEVEQSLQILRDSLLQLGARLARSYPTRNAAIRLSKRAVATLDALSIELEHQRRRDHPAEFPEEALYGGTLIR